MSWSGYDFYCLIRDVPWFNHGEQPSTHSHSHSFTLPWVDGEWTIKLLSWYKDSLIIGGRKNIREKNIQEGKKIPLPPGEKKKNKKKCKRKQLVITNLLMPSQSPSTCSPCQTPPSPVLLLSMMWYGTGYSFGQLRTAVATVSLPSLLCTSNLLVGGAGWGAEQALTLCMTCPAITKAFQCYVLTLFSPQIWNLAPCKLLWRNSTLSTPKSVQDSTILLHLLYQIHVIC